MPPNPAKPHPALVFLNAKKDHLLAAVPKTLAAALTWERIMQAVGMALAKSEQLQRCSPESIYRSVLDIIGKGLDIGMDGQAYLVPFKGECTPMIGAQGKIELAYRSGLIDKIVCQVVYENDTIDIDLANGTVEHPMTIDYLRRIAKEGGRGDMLAAYSRIWVKGVSEPILELMTVNEFEKIKADASKRTGGKLSPAYKEWPSEMFRRSVLNRGLKRAPKSRDLMDVLNREMELEGEPVSTVNRDVVDADAATPAALADHGEQEDLEAKLERFKERERVTVDEPPFATAEGEVMP